MSGPDTSSTSAPPAPPVTQYSIAEEEEAAGWEGKVDIRCRRRLQGRCGCTATQEAAGLEGKADIRVLSSHILLVQLS